ncbi:4-hydroxy-tetrahydrodipicolinate synthase [Formivibrio citricus]|uniref:4-hydroxy-tetrahydrodipicolinate synthase n=1 Tax=Formivibrio citricus TaxID=83765 RepID=A0A1I5E0Z2_9NEIS|nr:dihydrodipicolinate synthase family protein [Formivibrio citricus]SFO04791.1 4-hydroxy-tetrahydrodipicolinate synthase [Formivibrio citricus]
MKNATINLRGLVPAPVTPFTPDGAVDYAAIKRLGSWLGSIGGIKGLTVLSHTGEGTFLHRDEQLKVIETFVESTDGRIPVIAGITLEGTDVAAKEAQRAKEAGAAAGLLYPSHGWLRFGYQKGAPQDKYRHVYEESGLPLILFQYPDVTKCTYNLETLLDISAQPGVFAMKNGVRNMRRWDTEIPVIRKERPDLQILSCHDEYLMSTVFDVDGLLVGYGCLAPEPLIEMIKAGKAKDYKTVRAIHERLRPLTQSIYCRDSHMEGSAALKHGLVTRGVLEHATVRSPLQQLESRVENEIANALQSAGLVVKRKFASRNRKLAQTNTPETSSTEHTKQTAHALGMTQ